MHKINSQKLKELIKAQGESGLARTALGAQVGISTLEKMCAGTYESFPRSALRERLARFFKVPESEIFPGVKAGKKTA